MFGIRTSLNKNMIVILLCFFASAYQLYGMDNEQELTQILTQINTLINTQANPEAIQLLIKRIEAKSPDERQMFIKMLKHLWTAIIHLHFQNYSARQTALLYAIQSAAIHGAGPEIVEFLLQLGVSPNFETHKQRAFISPAFVIPVPDNAFILVTHNPLTEVLASILRHGSYSHLTIPIKMFHPWIPILKLLVQYGADPNAPITIIRFSQYINLLELIVLTPALSEEQRKDLIAYLLSHGANPFAKATIDMELDDTRSALKRFFVRGTLYDTYPLIAREYDFLQRAKREQLAEANRERTELEMKLLKDRLPLELVDKILDIERKLPTRTPAQQQEQRERDERIEKLNQEYLDRELEEIDREMKEEQQNPEHGIWKVD